MHLTQDVKPLLKVQQLCIVNETGQALLDDLNFELYPAQTLAMVGESGSGKSITALALLGLLPETLTGQGVVQFKNDDLLKLNQQQLQQLRGKAIAMIFQEPMTALNPLHKVEKIVGENLILQGLSKAEAQQKVINLLHDVGIEDAQQILKSYPHQLSGGQRQRVMIAMALAGDPELLIADEPTTALDVTIQAQILDLLKSLQKKLNMSIIIITHDLGVISEMADEVVVMYAGEIVEKAKTRELFDDPKHPYTVGLMNSVPDVDEDVERLRTLEGLVPSLYDMPKGCRFAPRCQFACPECEKERIKLLDLEDGRQVRCRRYEK